MPSNEYDQLDPDDLYIQTFSGKRFYFNGTGTEGVCLGDIAHALSMVTRYTGHVSRPYTVAEHSLLVLSIVDTLFLEQDEEIMALKRWHALMHDAPEAYLADLSSPLKSLVPGYRELEDSVWRRIARHFGVPHEMHEDVKAADWIALYVEAASLQPNTPLKEWERSEDFLPVAEEWIKVAGPVANHMPHPIDVRGVFTKVQETLQAEIVSASSDNPSVAGSSDAAS